MTGTAGLVAIAGLQLKLSSLGFSSSTVFLSGKHNCDSTFASLCAFARLASTGFLSAAALACTAARPAARLLGAL